MSSYFLSLIPVVKWSFFENDPSSNGSTTQDDDGTLHIFMNANNFWPLLSDEYTEGEKLPIRLKIASTMLHELCVRLLPCFKISHRY